MTVDRPQWARSRRSLRACQRSAAIKSSHQPPQPGPAAPRTKLPFNTGRVPAGARHSAPKRCLARPSLNAGRDLPRPRPISADERGSPLRVPYQSTTSRAAEGSPIAPHQSEMRYLAKPSSVAPAASMDTPSTASTYACAAGPVSNRTDVPGIGAKVQFASAEGLIVPWSTM
jgi:hypothetical protein